MPKHQTNVKEKDFSLSNVNVKTKTLVLVATGVFFLLLSVIQPSIFASYYRSGAASSAKRFEIHNFVQAGQFRNSERLGGSHASLDSTFYGVHLLSHQHHLDLSHTNKTRDYVLNIRNSFPKDIKVMYEGLFLLNKLNFHLTQDQKDEYYKNLFNLQERDSGFRLNTQQAASIEGTHYAFQSIIELGKFDLFSNSTEFQSALNFVLLMKDPQSHGFKDKVKEDPSLQATWFATKILNTIESFGKHEQTLRKGVEGLDLFVLSCQTQDGGFVSRPIKSLEQLYYGSSNTANTAKALYVLEFTHSATQSRISYGPYNRALNYLRSSLTFSGVRSDLSGKVDLETTYYFFELIDEFPHINYGVPVEYSSLMITIGLIFLLLSLYPLYKHQLPTESSERIYQQGRAALIFLVLGYVVLKIFPNLTVLVYLGFGFYLTIEMYKLQNHKDMTEDLFLVALINSTIYLGAIFGMAYVAPFVFAQVSFFSVLVGVGAIATAITTIGAPYFIPTKLNVLLIVAFESWVFNVVGQYVYLYGRGDYSLIYRVITSSGQTPVVFVLVPFALLVVHYFATTVAATVVLFPPTKKKKSE
eukprot:TRINITY_DN15604_c0_g1_i1.p1 TRINITY_DN15604_c0_g1~~TRINITY_DN15604_c0_g1_i1.p1  ORF type:complete len:585 (-),score=144.19 TRINITY_DN15604_c0_g1_i1:28-1782(-)